MLQGCFWVHFCIWVHVAYIDYTAHTVLPLKYAYNVALKVKRIIELTLLQLSHTIVALQYA